MSTKKKENVCLNCMNNFVAVNNHPNPIPVDYHASTPMTSLFCMKLFCDVRFPLNEQLFYVWCQYPPRPPNPDPKMFCWLINSGSLQTSSYDGLSGQELVTEPDLTSAFVSAWPLSWLLNERWRNEPLKNPSELPCLLLCSHLSVEGPQ